MPQIRQTLQMPQMRLHRTIKAKNMGSIIVTYKIFPEDIVKDFTPLKADITAKLPKTAEITGYGEEPVAFGLVALLVQVRFPEEESGLVDELETKLGQIKGISQVQTLDVRRSSR